MKPRLTFALIILLCSLLGNHARAGINNDFADEQGEVVNYKGEQYIRVTNPNSALFGMHDKFVLKDCLVLHPTENLGTIDLAEQKNNRISDDPDNPEFEEECTGLEIGKEKVIFEGAKPSIVDFINATLPKMEDEEGDCDRWAGDWRMYQLYGEKDDNVEVVIDRSNGYARMERNYSEGPNAVVFHEFCFWNLPDGKHKLFAANCGIIENGKALETECTGMVFYIYDNDTRTISFLGVDNYVLGCRPTDNGDITYLLPRQGKDISYVDGSGKKGILRWNGNGFGKHKLPRE